MIKIKFKPPKKPQIRLMHITIDQLYSIEQNHYLLDNVSPRIISTSENLFFHTLFRLKEESYPPVYQSREDYTEDVFILKTPMIADTANNTLVRERFESMIRNGIHVKGKLYKRSIQSVAMKRQQKTMFVLAELQEQLECWLSLGKNRTVNTAVISKWEAAVGLSLSTVNLLEVSPYVVIVPDLHKTISEDVLMFHDYVSIPEELENNNRLSELMARKRTGDEARAKAWTAAGISAAYLDRLPAAKRHIHKGAAGWKKENRLIIAGEVSKPAAKFEYNGRLYGAYSKEQTEKEVIIPVTPFTLGKQMEWHESFPYPVNVFDGQGIITPKFAAAVGRMLEIDYVPNAVQFRDLFMKGMLIQFDIEKFSRVHQISTIKDIWGEEHLIAEIDIIASESQFKAAQEKREGSNRWIFESMAEYRKLKAEYGFKHIGVCAIDKPRALEHPYLFTTYQHLNAFHLDYESINTLARETIRLAKKLIEGQDVGFIKAFFELYSRHVEEDDLSSEDYGLRDYFAKAIDINHEMKADPHLRNYLSERARHLLQGLMLGKFLVKGFKQFAVCDITGFAEWVILRKEEHVKGVLGKGEYCSVGTQGTYAGIRNPCTHYSEVLKGRFVAADNEFIRHLDTVVQFNMYDLSALRMGGMDWDGDVATFFEHELFINGIINSPVVAPNPENTINAKPLPLNIDSVVAYELFSLSNRTGLVTNISSTLNDAGNAKDNGSPVRYTFSVAYLKLLQGAILDSQKTFEFVEVPEVLVGSAKRKPYYFRYVDFGREDDYEGRNEAVSPLSNLVKHTEDYIANLHKNNDNVNGINLQTYRMLQDRNRYTAEELQELVLELKPVYEYYISEKALIKAIFDNEKVYGRDERKSHEEQRRVRYAELNQEIKRRAMMICGDLSLLASAGVLISYVLTKEVTHIHEFNFRRNDNYSFPWIIAGEGLIGNLKKFENHNKEDVFEIRALDNLGLEYHGELSVSGGNGSIQGRTFPVKLEEGKYNLENILGKHYAQIVRNRNTGAAEVFSSLPKIANRDKLPYINEHPVKLMRINPELGLERLYTAISTMKLTIALNPMMYISLYQEETYLASLDRGGLMGKGYLLEDYVGCRARVSSTYDKRQKTFRILLNIIPEDDHNL